MTTADAVGRLVDDIIVMVQATIAKIGRPCLGIALKLLDLFFLLQATTV